MAAVIESPTDLVAGVEELFTLPALYMRVKALIEDPETSIADVADLISGDPAIAARLLKFANSAFFGQSRQVDTVSRAVTVLGTQVVHDVVLATSVVDSCAVVADSVDLRTFWSNSAYCAVLARQLAERCNVLDSERIFLEGLLRDIGHLVMVKQVPEQLADARQQARATGRQLYQLEWELIGCHYGEVGQQLMTLWQLPPSFGEVARYHVEPGQTQASPLEAAIVHIAHHITVAAEAGGEVDLPIQAAAWQTTGLSVDVIDSVRTDAAAELSEAQALFVDSD
ncbi:MAG: HDOD domain-containing protein [Gammaproteobacteria bacterium]|nr:HDOD domain-containing protein [Gammaproteobacteria bacterium]